MKYLIPKEVVALTQLLTKAGYQAYIVGGSVRDLLLERPVHDWDLTTSARPEEIQSVLAHTFYENNFGTVSVTQAHLHEQLGSQWPTEQTSQTYEITTFRSEGTYSDHRRPDQVEWGTNTHGRSQTTGLHH